MMTELQKQVDRLRTTNAFVGSVATEYQRFGSLFLSPKEAAGVDIEVVYEAAMTGLMELRQYDDRFGHYLNNLMHSSSTSFQRELKTGEVYSKAENRPYCHYRHHSFSILLIIVIIKQENKVLNKQLAIFFQHISIFSNEPSAHRIFEYLIRRYQVHEHNAEVFIKSVLSIHDTKVAFTKHHFSCFFLAK